MLLRKKWYALAMVTLSLMVAACVTYQAMRPDRGLKFNHEKHPAKDLACEDCHSVENGEPGMPSHDTCSVCHDQADLSKSKECDYCHSQPDQAVKPIAKVLSPEAKFGHAKHLDKKIECKTCHPNPDKSVVVSGNLMTFCMDCHTKTGQTLTECSVCHKEIRKNVRPKYHGPVRIAHDSPQIWEKIHGQQSKNDPKFCALCHDDQTSCEECHRKNPPQDHTITWRRKSHGLRATWERERCAACHEEDSCLRCHQHNAPQSHHGGWGPPSDRHCVQCHYPPRETGCTVCHEDIEHKSAEPSPHDLGLFPARCAPCHPFNNPYRAPHPLNSTVRCVVCH
jgi:hypothetical protein